MDSWLIWWLTGGPNGGVHATDPTNASRTMLMNLDRLAWDPELLDAFGIPAAMLPSIRSSSEVYGHTRADGPFGGELPVAGDLGDQQAALFGQACYQPGQAKNTYGTGCFLLLNTGTRPVPSRHGLLTTVGYQLAGQPAVYALEGSVAIAGSLIQWIRDNLGLIASSPEIEDLARTVPDSGGVYFVPAFSGLFAPHWKSDARGLIIGLTHYVTKSHLARAALEAVAYQTLEVFDVMTLDSGIRLKELKVDGGMVHNELLMGFQADLLGIPVIRPRVTETTVQGAAFAAGLAVGFWNGLEELAGKVAVERIFSPTMDDLNRQKLYEGWRRAVNRTLDWVK
jgi:glycerol kinase